MGDWEGEQVSTTTTNCLPISLPMAVRYELELGLRAVYPLPLLSWPRDQGTPVVREMYIWKCSKLYTRTIYSWL